MARRSKQLDVEVAAALAKGAPHPEATVTDWKKVVAGIQKRARKTADPHERSIIQEEFHAAMAGLRSAEKRAASKPTFLTETNLYALTALVVKSGGPSFSNRLDAVDRSHIKRCLDASLVEIVGGSIRLTDAGREVVGDRLIRDIARESAYTPKTNPFLSGDPEHRARIHARDVAEHDAKVQRLEATLANLRG